MLFHLFFICELIKKPIGEANYLPRLSLLNLTRYISNTPNCVVIYANSNTARFDFINFAVTKYQPKIKFVIAPMSDLPLTKFNFKTIQETNNIDFIIVPYKNGQKYDTIAAPRSPIEFAAWCDLLIRPLINKISYASNLRQIFDEHNTVFFGVNMVSRPDYLNDINIPFYLVSNILFEYLNITVSDGLYIYRPADRQLIKTGENYKKFLKSPLVDFSYVFSRDFGINPLYPNLNKIKYFGGFFVDPNNRTETSSNVLTLSKLATKFPNVLFGLFEGQLATQILTQSNFNLVRRPFFALFDINSIHSIHYPSLSKKYDDLAHFVDSILKDEIDKNQMKLSGDCSEPNLCYHQYDSIISNRQNDLAVVYTEGNMRLTRNLFSILKKTIPLFKEKINLLKYDLAENEIPENLQFVHDLPILVYYPKNKDAVYFESEITVHDVVEFIHSSKSTKTEFPEFNEQQIIKEIEVDNKPMFTFKDMTKQREEREKGEL